MKYYLSKSQVGLVPVDPESQEWFNRLKTGQVVSADFRQVRNYRFLKKWFALLKIGFDNWEPGEIDSKHGTPEKNFDRFRADVTILAGYYETTIRLDGSVRVEPKSVSFARMTEEEFGELYSKTIDTLIKYVYGSGMTPEDMDKTVERYLQFA